MFQEVKTGTDDQVLGTADGNTPLRRVMFVIIESGSALVFFFFQLIRLVLLTLVATTDAYYIFASLHTMPNVIIRVNGFFFD